MKILQISRTMGQGGAEKVVFELCKDINIDMAVASTGGHYVKELEKINRNHYNIPDITNKNPYTIIKIYKSLKKIIEKENITIIHSHHRMAAFYAQLLKRHNSNLKLMYTAHNSFYDKKRLTKYSLRNTDIIACGNSVKNNLIDIYDLPKERIEVVPNSIKVQKIKSEELISKTNETKVVSIGRLSKQKGLDTFIKAIAKTNNTHGYIIGDGELLNKLENLTRKLNIEDRISFLGFRENILGFIEASDFIVLSSRWEGFPLTPIETFACKKTIIASDIPGNTDIIENGKNGLLFEKDNVEDLASKIILLAKDQYLRKQLEAQAKTDFLKKFSYNNFINSYKNAYVEAK